jgi:hypothetical protein
MMPSGRELVQLQWPPRRRQLQQCPKYRNFKVLR